MTRFSELAISHTRPWDNRHPGPATCRLTERHNTTCNSNLVVSQGATTTVRDPSRIAAQRATTTVRDPRPYDDVTNHHPAREPDGITIEAPPAESPPRTSTAGPLLLALPRVWRSESSAARTALAAAPRQRLSVFFVDHGRVCRAAPRETCQHQTCWSFTRLSF